MARKKGLPFVVQPRLKPIVEQLGTEESGIIEIERKGYLTVAEKSIVQGVATNDTSLRQLMAIARKVSEETGRSPDDIAKQFTQSPLPDYLQPYQEEVTETLVSMLEFQERSSIIQATALLICRVDDGWTVDQTMELHPDLISALALLYYEEERKDTEKLEKKQDANVATKGKP